MRERKIGNYYLGLTIVFFVYLVILSIIGKSENISPFFYYGFWLVLGLLLGFRICAYLYEKAGNQDDERKQDDKFRLN
jgi:hypothetical protein